jgi:hypothetical protein
MPALGSYRTYFVPGLLWNRTNSVSNVLGIQVADRYLLLFVLKKQNQGVDLYGALTPWFFSIIL